MSDGLDDFTPQELEALILRDLHDIPKPRHKRTKAKWSKMVQFRGLCRCCGFDPVVVSVVNEKRRERKVLCLDCYLAALDLVKEGV